MPEDVKKNIEKISDDTGDISSDLKALVIKSEDGTIAIKIEDYIKHFEEIHLRHEENLKRLIANVEEIKTHMILADQVVSTLPDISKDVQQNTNKIDLLNDKTLNAMRWLVGTVALTFGFTVLWNTLPLADRQQTARQAFLPVAGIIGVGAIGWIFGKEFFIASDQNETDKER